MCAVSLHPFQSPVARYHTYRLLQRPAHAVRLYTHRTILTTMTTSIHSINRLSLLNRHCAYCDTDLIAVQ